MNQIISNKRETYHIQIRKDKKHQQLREKRKRFINEFIEQPKTIYANSKQRDDALTQIYTSLQTQPSEEWNELLAELNRIVRHFQQFSIWSQLGIINKLLLTFNQDFRYLNLTSKSSSILNFIVHQLSVKSSQSTKFVSHLVDQGIIQNLLQIINNKNIQTVIEELYLLGNVMSENGYYRNRFVEGGWIQIIQAFFSNAIQNSQHLQLLSWLASQTVRDYQSPEQKLKYSVGALFIEIFATLILSKESTYAIKIDGIFGLNELGKRNQTDIKNMYNYPGLLRAILDFAQSEEHPSFFVWSLLTLLSSTRLEVIGTEMIKKGIVNLIDCILQRDSATQDAQLYIDSVIRNLILNSSSDCDHILRSNLTDHIIKRCKSTSEHKRKANLKTLDYLVDQLNYSQCQYLLKRHDILHEVVQSLTSTESNDTQKVCIRIVKSLIVKYATIYQENGVNRIGHKLKNDYNMIPLLQNIISENKHTRVVEAAQELLCILEQNSV